MLNGTWEWAQGKPIFWVRQIDGEWPKRCTLCGRRLSYNDHVTVLVGTARDSDVLILNDICFQHGGQHADCLRGAKIDFGERKSWMLIWLSNILHELSFWCITTIRFTNALLSYLLHVVLHPRRYYKLKKMGWESYA